MPQQKRRERYPGDYSPLRFRVVTGHLQTVLHQHIPQFSLRVKRDGKGTEYPFEGVANLGHTLQMEVENTTDSHVKMEIITRSRVTSVEDMLYMDPNAYFSWRSAIDWKRKHTIYAADIVYHHEMNSGEAVKVSMNYEAQLVADTENLEKREDYKLNVVDRDGFLRVINKLDT